MRAIIFATAAVFSVASLAVADVTDGVYRVASEHPTQAPRALPVPMPRGTTYFVPGARVTPVRVTLAARDNANTIYDVDVRWAHGGGSWEACDRALLRLGTRTYLTRGWGGDDRECSANFELDPREAQRAAALFHTTRQDRHPVGEHVVGVFALASSAPAPGTPSGSPSSSPRYRVGEPIEIVLTMTSSPGAPPVAWERGGQNRGPRDDQFDFTVTRDGQPRIEAMNFGGLSFMDELPPGERDEARTLLAPWADVTQPGHYEVTCSFHTVFAPAGVSPFEPATRGQAWERTFTGTVSFDVARAPGDQP
jgi:hypothetical protein